MTVTIIVIFGTMIAVAWPQVRVNQGFILAEEAIQSALHNAQEKAINEERVASCLSLFTSAADKRRCSDIGIALRNSDMILFADTSGSNHRYTAGDVILEQTKLIAPVIVETPIWRSFLFEAIPPNVTLYGTDGLLIGAGANNQIRLRFGNTTTTKDFIVLPYGQLQAQ